MLTEVVLLLLWSSSFGQKKQDLTIDYMLRGHLYGKSSKEDTTSIGNFGGKVNLPKKIDENLSFGSCGLLLKIDTAQKTTINNKYNGYKLYIANKTDKIVGIRSTDGQLHVIAEVLFRGRWKPIEFLDESFCLDSYFRVNLNPNEYWEFDIPKFSGKTKTKLRYKLDLVTRPYIHSNKIWVNRIIYFLGLAKHNYLYSNKILTSINKGQIKNRQDYIPNGIMDPYNY
jgi:hypothetical protein